MSDGISTSHTKMLIIEPCGSAPSVPTDGSALYCDAQGNLQIAQAGSAWTNLVSSGGGGDISAAWPVGSVFISTLTSNPAMLFGFGTWAVFAAGRVLVGVDATQAEFNVLGELGGNKTHTLAITEIPAHTHTVMSQTATSGSATSYEHGALDTTSTEAEATEVTGMAGGGQPHNNLQPYITVAFWVRTL